MTKFSLLAEVEEKPPHPKTSNFLQATMHTDFHHQHDPMAKKLFSQQELIKISKVRTMEEALEISLRDTQPQFQFKRLFN